MNEQPIKRTSKGLIAIIVTIVIIIILSPIVITILMPKLLETLVEKNGYTNYQIENLKLSIPSNWKKQGNYEVSPSGNCRIIGGTTLFEQNRTERILLEDELEHKIITISNIEMSYGYKDNGKEKIYSYYFEDYNKKYFIIFRNNIDSDEACDSYIEKIEQSITLKSKGEEI